MSESIPQSPAELNVYILKLTYVWFRVMRYFKLLGQNKLILNVFVVILIENDTSEETVQLYREGTLLVTSILLICQWLPYK